jgi:hypothetical protein
LRRHGLKLGVGDAIDGRDIRPPVSDRGGRSAMAAGLHDARRRALADQAVAQRVPAGLRIVAVDRGHLARDIVQAAHIGIPPRHDHAAVS